MLSDFEKRVGITASGEYDAFHLNNEADPLLSRRIEEYWRGLDLHFPGVAVAWSVRMADRLDYANPARTARSASSSWACG
jgi:hypothetical protein